MCGQPPVGTATCPTMATTFLVIVAAIERPTRRASFLWRFVVEEVEDGCGKVAVGFVPSGFKIFFPVLCPRPAVVIDIAVVARCELSRPAFNVDDVRQAFHVR